MRDFLDYWVIDGGAATPPHVAVSPAAELRSAPREAVRGTVSLVPEDDAHAGAGALLVELRDCSRYGLGFVTPRRLAPDTRWLAQFTGNARALGRQLLSIRHCERLGSGYFAGAQFCIDPALLRPAAAGHAPA